MYRGTIPAWRTSAAPSRVPKPRTTAAHSRSQRSRAATNQTATNKGEPLHETPIPVAIAPRIRALLIAGKVWYAASNEGLFISEDQGRKWYGEPLLGKQDLIGVQPLDAGGLVAISPAQAFLSRDAGKSWTALTLPTYLTVIYGVTATNGSLWLSTREGALRSSDRGNTWEHVLSGLPARDVLSLFYDAGSQRLLATGLHNEAVFESKDDGKTWQPLPTSIVSVRSAMWYEGRILVATSHNGLLLQSSTGQASTGSHTGDGASASPISTH